MSRGGGGILREKGRVTEVRPVPSITKTIAAFQLRMVICLCRVLMWFLGNYAGSELRQGSGMEPDWALSRGEVTNVSLHSNN